MAFIKFFISLAFVAKMVENEIIGLEILFSPI